jgi:sulfur carrier protein
MIIKINGNDQVIKAELSIQQLIKEKGLDPAKVVVEHNYNIPSREKWHEITVKEDDNIEIVSFVGGG